MPPRSPPASRDDVVALAAAVSAILGVLALDEQRPTVWLAELHRVLQRAVFDQGEPVMCALDGIFSDACLAVRDTVK